MATDNEGTQSRPGNRALTALTDEERARVWPHLEEGRLRAGDVLAHAGDRITHVSFPLSGLVSMVASTSSGSTLEVAFVGREGMAGGVALLGRDTMPYGLVTRLPGRVLRMPATVIHDEGLLTGNLLSFLHRYVQAVIAQVTQSALCNRFHSPHQRLSRWLAQMFDRAGSDAVPMTHEFIADMVGGARSLVTEISNELRRDGVIDYRRGSLRLLDARRLRDGACECYGAVNALLAAL